MTSLKSVNVKKFKQHVNNKEEVGVNKEVPFEEGAKHAAVVEEEAKYVVVVEVGLKGVVEVEEEL